MAFSESVKSLAYLYSGGYCECERSGCGHRGRCNRPLANGWEAHHKLSQLAGGADTVANCEALCLACHRNTQSYGRS